MSNHHKFHDSKAIRHCDYDDEKGIMEICFSSGGTFKYECDKKIYEGLKNAESAGKHFHANIRNQYKPI